MVDKRASGGSHEKGAGGSHGGEGLGCELLEVQYAVGQRGPGVELLVFLIFIIIITSSHCRS